MDENNSAKRQTSTSEHALEEARRLVGESQGRIAYYERRLSLMSWCGVEEEMAIGPSLLASHYWLLEARLAYLGALEGGEKRKGA